MMKRITSIKTLAARAAVLLVMLLTTMTAWATTTSSINVGGTDYTLFTGFTATGGTASYGNFVDGNLSNKWQVMKKFGTNPSYDFVGGTEDPAFVEFHADAPIIPKGYVLTYDNSANENWKPTSWALKAKLSESDNWTTLHSSSSSLGSGSHFEIACNNDGDNEYQYFRFEIYDVGTTMQSVLNELQFYGNEYIYYTHLTVTPATCTATGIKQDCYRRSDGKYFTDETGATELAEADVIDPMIPHTGVHHEAGDGNIEYWQCSMCSKYFTDAACTQEVTADEVLKTVFGTLTIGTNGASGYYTLESKTYTLTEDVNTAGYIYVPEGVTATIDLAGHTIDRGLTSAVENGMVIWVAGSLTVTDSGTGGKIKGGMDSENNVSCVLVYSDNGSPAFTLQGGTLIGNTSYQFNSAVLAPSNSSITISGGKITGDVYGILSNGNVAVSGGEISGNTTGIRSQNNSVSVSGNPVITNNTNANVMLYYGDASVLTIAGELTDGANIGITKGGANNPTDNAPVTITSGYSTYNSEPIDTYFSLDNNGQIQTGPSEYMTLVMGWNEDRTEIAVGTAMRTVTFDLQGHGSAIEAVSLLSGYKLTRPTEPTAEGWSFGGWYTDEDCTDANAWDFTSGVTSGMTLYALWTQGQMYRVTLPENMIVVSADNAAVGGKYPTGTNIRFKAAPDYVVDGDGIYTVTVADADITITATVKKAAEPNKTLSGSESYTAQDGDVLTGSTSGTVTIADGASITLSDVAITGGIVCNGTATIALVGTNSVTGATQKAGIQIGGSGTTLTIRGNGSLTANGQQHSAGIGLSRAWNPDGNVIGGDIVIEGGNITANGNSQWGAGIGTGVIYGNGSAKTARIGNITIKGGSVKATGGTDANGIGTGYTYSGCTNAIGTVTIYDGINMVDASSIKDFASVVYKHVDGETETDVTASKTDYFAIGEDGNRRLIVQKPVIAEIAEQAYTGSEIKPEPTVTIGSITLTKGTDYVYSYTNNTDAGTATVRATFQGTYTSLGYVEQTFVILPWTYNAVGGYYEISDADDLNALATYVNGGNNASGKTFKQTADIDMQGVSYTPIGNDEGNHVFNGTYDGDGYFILNISHSISGVNEHSGLFGDLRGTVKNVNLKDCNFTAYRVGAIAGQTSGDCLIQNCNVLGGTITGTDENPHDTHGSYMGGIVGYFYDKTATNCFTTAAFSGDAYHKGSVVGWNGGTVTDCYYVNTPGGNSYGTQVTVYNITLGDGITMSGNFRTVGRTAANTYYFGKENDAITLTATPVEGKTAIYSVNGTPIDGNTFTMPAGDVTVSVEFVMTWADLKTAMTAGGTRTVTLTNNVARVNSDCINASGTVTLDLNGYTIDGGTSQTYPLFSVNNGVSLTITDSQTGGNLCNAGSASAVRVNEGGTLTLAAGTINSQNAQPYGVCVDKGSFIMTGGTITGAPSAACISTGTTAPSP